MPGSIRSMQVEHVFRDVQTDRGSLLHGRLLRWQFDTVTLAHRCRRGASTPSPNSADLGCRRGGRLWGMKSGSHAQGRTAGVGFESGPLLSRLTTETFEADFSASWGADPHDLCAAALMSI